MFSSLGPRPPGTARTPSNALEFGNWRTINAASQQPSYAYDRESGLVFSESKVSVSKRQAHDWIGEPRSHAGPRIPYQINGDGAGSLQDMTARSAARNVRSLTADHLYDVPWPTAKKIWQNILRSRLESFHAWRIFASAYPGPFASPNARYQITIREPALPLVDYYAGLSSSPARWMTCLRISPRYTPTSDLVNVASIGNLAVLDLSDDFTIDAPRSVFDERIMKSWVELIRSCKAFRHLRVLMLGWQEFPAAWIFKYLKDFPSLCCIIFTDCPKLHQRNKGEWEEEARSLGWVARSAKRSAKSLRPIVGESDFHIGAVSGIYYESKPRFAHIVHDLKPLGMEDGLPVVECWIGRPRLWTHMIDEFPGTRTVWFDNVKTTESVSVTRDRDADQMDTDNVSSYDSKKGNKASVRRSGKGNGTKTLEDLLKDFSKR